jgi:hypothetical protein
MRETDDLPEAESLLLDALRAAAMAPAPRHAAALVLAARDAARAAAAVSALAAGAARPDLRAPLCPRVGPEEEVLLGAVALAQRGARREALALLCRVLPPVEAYRAMAQMIAVASCFRIAGLSLGCPWRSGLPGFRASGA